MKYKIEKTNVQEIFELSTVQKGMLFHHLKEAGGNQYNVQLAFGIEGNLDIAILDQAIQAVQLNHEALRSVFSWDKVSKPLQVVLKHCPVEFTYHNLARHGREFIEDYVAEFITADQRKRFDLTALPVRITLIRTGDASFVFCISHHHILYDGWSTGIFLQELFSAYQQLSRRQQVNVDVKPSFKQVLQALKKKPSAHHISNFWKTYLENYETKLLFNNRFEDSPEIKKYELTMPGTGLDSFARQHSVTKAAVIYAAFGLLLQKYLNTLDIVFGTTVSDRDAALAGIEKVMGNFINTIPLRLRARNEQTLGEIVQAVHEGLLERNAYNSTSYYEIRDLLKLKPEDQLFDALLVVENYPLDVARINCNEEFTLRLKAVYENTSFPLVVCVFFEPELRVELAWKAGYMEEEFAYTLAAHFEKLLRQIIEQNNAKVQSVSLLSATDMKELVEEFNNTAVPYPKDKTISELFEQQVRQTPGAIAIKYGSKQLSYAELNSYANRIAAYLREMKGVTTGDLAGVLLDRDEHLVPVILGILKTGAAYVPVDPEYPAHRVNAIVEAAGLKVLVSRKKLLNAAVAGIVDLDNDLDTLYNYPPEPVRNTASSKDLVYIIYTSGSTGTPKGVMITHQSLVNYISFAAGKYVAKEKAAFPLYTSISFDLTVTSIFTPLITGNTIVIFNEQGFVIEKVLANNDINIIKATPSHLKIVRDSNRINPSADDVVRIFIVGGEELSTQLAKDIHDKFHGRVKIYNEYGPTEATVGCMIYQFDPAEQTATVPIGVPIQNTRIYVLDKDLHPIPKGCPGELYISGDGIAKGYLGNKELTAEKFIKDPFAKGNKMYRTGDLARWLPGNKLEFLGRIDEQIKLRGFRIELAEIESQLRLYEGIREVAITVKEKNGEKSLSAWYVSDNEIAVSEIKSFLSQKLPAYMVPAYFTRLKELPLTANGKLDKRALPDPVVAPAITHSIPTGEVEKKLLQIWSDVLGHSNISIHSNFFDIGGDSLKLLTVSSKIKTLLNKDVQVTDLTFYPTIASLAKFIDPAVEAQQPVEEETQETTGQAPADIAVIGMAGRFPGAENINAFWQNLAAGKELIVRGENHGSIINAKAFLEGYDLFDTEFFQYTPADAAMMDPQIRVFHECVWEALENAGYVPSKFKGAIGLYGGATANPYYNLNVNTLTGDDLLEEWAGLTYSDKDFLCPRVSYKLNLKGPSVNVFTACSTSLVAIETACNELLANKCSIAVAGGVSITLHDEEGYVYRPGMVMSPDGYCRAFDEKAAGTVGGNGVGAVVLKKLDEALRDNDHIYAVIKGTATNNDGNAKVGFAAPAMDGQAKVIESAIKNAGVEAESISYVETHGSGTLIGDPIEVTALAKAFNSGERQYCAIGSVKTNIGHLDAAAGVAGFIKTALALKNKQIPPSLHYEKPNPNIDFANSPFYVNTELAYWKNGRYPRRAGVSSFGIGGTNVHIVMEEAPEVASAPGREYKLLMFSGKTPAALENNIKKHAAYLQENAGVELADVAYTLQVGREYFPYRKIAVCKNEAVAILEELAATKTTNPYSGEYKPKVVFMFPGQGSQYMGMCRDLYAKEEIFRKTVDQCAAIVKNISGKDLFPQDAETLDRTEYTQPALFAVEYALAKLLMHWGIQPDYMIGHSFGEYVAACISGVFSLEDALFLVVKRGELMQKAPAGVTIAIAITQEKLEKVLAEYENVSLATVNSSELCVVAGDAEAVYALRADVESQGHACSVVSTAHAFHSHKMDSILDEFEQSVNQVIIHPAQMPFISNLTGKIAGDTTSSYWVQHLRNTVRFADGLEYLMQNKELVFIEAGPGIELCTFVRSISARLKSHKVVNLVRHPDKEGDDQYHLLTALGRLWQSGVEPDWTKFYGKEKRRRIPLPTYSFARLKFPVKKAAPAFIAPKDDLIRIQDISQWFYLSTWKMSPWSVQGEHEAETILLFDGEQPVTRLLAEVFKRNGDTVIHVRKGTAFAEESATAYFINPGTETDYSLLFERLQKRNLQPKRIIHAWAIDRNSEYETQQARDLYEVYFYSITRIVKAAEQHGGMFGRQITYLTNDLYSIAGDEPVALLKSLPVGLLKVIGQEYPTATVNQLDISLNDFLHDALLNKLYHEIKREDGGNTIAVRNGKKWVQAFDTIESKRVQFREGGVYLITGGLGNVGYHLAMHLAKNFNAKLILTGRGSLQDEKLTRVEALEQSGAQVLYCVCDAADAEQLKNAMELAESTFGEINGIVHAAGIIHGETFNPINILRIEDYEQQFAAKVTGLQVLRKVVGTKPLDFCIITSSLSPILGGLEFGAYASANAYIEFFVNHYRERAQLNNWICANIDGFNLNGGKGEGINEMEVAEVFERILSVLHLPQVIVSVADIQKRVDRWVKRTAEKLPEISLANLTTTEEKIKSIWQQFFGIPELDEEDDFFELGGDSLKGLTMIGRIHKELNVEVPIKQLFNNSSIRKLASFIDMSYNGEQFRSIPLAPERDSYPLSSVQSRIYFLYEFDKQSVAYNQALTIRLKGEVSKARLQNAFVKLISRHESLRTCFEIIAEEPRQRVMDDFDFALELLSSTGREEDVIRRFIRPFDLNRAPLIRAGLIDVAANEHILVVDMHHIVTDAVSKGVLIKDFMAFYNGDQLQPMALQYKDFAEWQQQQDTNSQKQFWLEEFSGELPAIVLPADFPRPAVKNYDGSTVSFVISAEDTVALKKLVEKEGSTMFMLLLSAYNILLAKLSNQDDVIVGTITAGRQHPDLEQIIGMFVNTIPIRNKMRGDLSFTGLLEQVKSKALQCFENQSYPYEALIDELKVARDSSRNPLFDTLFSFRNYQQMALELPGLSIEPFEVATGISNFDITLSAIQKNDKLELEFEYCTRLFKRETVERFAGYFKNIIDTIILHPQVAIAEISLLSAEERKQLLTTFNDTAGIYNREETIVSLFEKQAMHTPDAIAVVYEGQQLSFRQLNEFSNQWAHYLRNQCNVLPDQAVAVMVERSEMMMVALLGVLKAGAAYIPIDPSYPQKRIEYILENSEASVVLADKPLSGMRFEGKTVLLDTVPGEPVDNPASVNTPGNLCYIIYTSGSTGNPKGVMVSHGNVINFFAGMNRQLPLTQDDCMLAVTSTSFDISVLELFWTLCQGVQVVIHPADISLSGLDRYVQTGDRSMDFSLFFFSSYNNGDEDKYRLLLESVQYADKQGFKAVWVPERHFHEFGGLFPNPSVLSAALAMATEQLQLRAGSVVAPLHDAVRIVEEWSVVDNLSNGRVGLSFASGWNPNDFVLSKVSYQDRNKTLYAKIDEAKRLWRGESVKRVNGLGKEAELRVFPEPVQKELPVWITSGGSEDTFISAGASGANLLTHLLGQDVEELERKVKLYRQARKEHGHDENAGIVTVMLHTYVGDSIEEVEKVVEQPFVEYLKSSIGLSRILTEETGLKEDSIPEKEKERIINNAFKRYYKTGSLIGTRSTCSDMVTKLKAIGVNEIACLIDFGVESQKVLAGLQNLKSLKSYFRKTGRLHKPITVMQSTPSFIKLMQEGAGAQQLLKSLRLLLIGGEAASLSLVRQLKHDTSAAIWNMYGPTETTIWSCIHEFPTPVEKIIVGKPILNTQAYILNKDQQLVPVGVTGELYIGGEGVARGYWKRADLTAQKFIANPFRPGEVIYQTGDLARWLPDGTIELAGREDHQLKIRGYRIEPGEIEVSLLGFAGMQEAVVIARESKDSSDKSLVAYLVAENAIDFTALRQHLAQRLPQYMIPSHFVQLNALPLTPNGKIDRKALPDPVIEAGREYIAPSTETEEKLVEIWAEILKIDKELVSVRANFFELGGHSLNAMVMVRKILKEFNVEILLQKIFVINTIEQISDVIDNERWVKKETRSTEPAGEEIIID